MDNFIFISKHDPRLAIDLMTSNTKYQKEYPSLIDYENDLSSINSFSTEEVEKYFDLSKFYVVPIHDEEMTLKLLLDTVALRY